ncbi:MAG TPA: sensor histidine kinase [Streptosporangiaceae bacterium]|nr:sensor histidine kinase [Streptosporangiaceae bacterium]
MSAESDISYPLDGSAALPSYPPTAGRPRPPLTKRLRPGHWMAIDLVVGGLVGLSAVLASTHGVLALPSRFLLAALIAVPVALRRRYPLLAFCALIVVAVGATAAGFALPAGPSFIFATSAYALYTVAVCCARRVSVAALLAAFAVGLATQLPVYQHHRSAGNLAWPAFALIIAWMTGHSARQRRRYAQMLQQEAASSAVAGERLRIARELHDVVAHSMSVIAVQAGYGQYVIDTSPADASEALGAIQATSRDALEEMRRMLGVLRQQDPELHRPRSAPLAPAPDLDDLDRLIQRTRGAGLQVSLERSGPIRAVPAGVGLSAYRIIQEALTNVVRHAGAGARCTVRLRYDESTLHVLVADDGGHPLVHAALAPSASLPAGTAPWAAASPVPGSGHGLVGMRERAHLCGGDLTAGPRPDGGFQVTATLPLGWQTPPSDTP